MKAVTTTLELSPDGSIHLPVPAELRGARKFRIVAWLESAHDSPPKPGAGEWALQSRGIASMSATQPEEDSRLDFLRKKFGIE